MDYVTELQFWGRESNKGEDELSSPGRHIHLSQSAGQCHQEQALFRTRRTANNEIGIK